MNTDKYPQTNPHETDQQPNPFEGLSSVGEVLPVYEQLLGSAIDEYVNEPARTGEFVQGISTRIERIMSTAGEILPGMLDDRSKAILESSGRYDVRSRHIPGLFAGAYPEMQPALNIIRDAGLLAKAREAVAKSNPYSRLVVETVGKGATPIARDAMQIVVNADELAKQRIVSERRQQTQGAGAEQSRSRAGSNSESDIFADGGLFGGKVGGAVFDALFGEAAKSPRSKTGKPAEVVPDRDPAQAQQRRIKDIMDKTAQKKEYEWIKDEPDAATRVVEYVDSRRQQAAKDGKTLTGRQLYVELRRAAETDPSRTGEVQTLEAMMGGVDGELPF